MADIKVTVVVMTYNQRLYIEEAINSILSQKTSFDFDIFVHDDCSDDGTNEILQKIALEHPNKIRIYKQDKRKRN